MQRLELVLVLELETNYNREPAVPVEQSGACSILCSALGVLGELSLDMLAWLLGRQGGGREGSHHTSIGPPEDCRARFTDTD